MSVEFVVPYKQEFVPLSLHQRHHICHEVGRLNEWQAADAATHFTHSYRQDDHTENEWVDTESPCLVKITFDLGVKFGVSVKALVLNGWVIKVYLRDCVIHFQAHLTHVMDHNCQTNHNNNPRWIEREEEYFAGTATKKCQTIQNSQCDPEAVRSTLGFLCVEIWIETQSKHLVGSTTRQAMFSLALERPRDRGSAPRVNIQSRVNICVRNILVLVKARSIIN